MKQPLPYMAKTPSAKALTANRKFLELANDDAEYIRQCDTCIHAANAPYGEWCDMFSGPPIGLCPQKEVKK